VTANPDLPMLPVNLPFEEVHEAAGDAVNPKYLREQLKRQGAIRRIGDQRSLVSSATLAKVNPELHSAVIQRRMLRS
jgi:hypothetical protein